MRLLFAAALLLSTCLSARQSYGQASPVAKAATSVSHSGTAYTIPLGPAPSQHQVQPEQVLQEPTYYVATLPVLRDNDGRISLNVVVNPKTHSVQKLSPLFAPLNEAVTYRQIGAGTGRYDVPTGRYYFNAIYQTTRKLPNGLTDNGPGRVITGWVKPGTSQAAVGDEAIPDKAD